MHSQLKAKNSFHWIYVLSEGSKTPTNSSSINSVKMHYSLALC